MVAIWSNKPVLNHVQDDVGGTWSTNISHIWFGRNINVQHLVRPEIPSQSAKSGAAGLTTKPPEPDNIGDAVKIPLISEWYFSIFTNYDKISRSTTFSASFLCSLLPPEKIIMQGYILGSRQYILTINTTSIQ